MPQATNKLHPQAADITIYSRKEPGLGPSQKEGRNQRLLGLLGLFCIFAAFGRPCPTLTNHDRAGLHMIGCCVVDGHAGPRSHCANQIGLSVLDFVAVYDLRLL